MKKSFVLLFAGMLIAVMGISIVVAAPVRQGVLIPTPTVPVVESSLSFEITTVAIEDTIFTYSGETIDGVVFSETTFEIIYPSTGILSIDVSTDPEVEIEEVALVIFDASGDEVNTAEATLNEETGNWELDILEGTDGYPTWLIQQARWQVVLPDSTEVDGPNVELIAPDNSREWLRAEREDGWIIYWFGLETYTPEAFATFVFDTIDATSPRRTTLFGEDVQPGTLVFYPSFETVSETEPPDWFDQQEQYVTYYPIVPYGIMYMDLENTINNNCPYQLPAEQRTEQWRVERAVQLTMTANLLNSLYFVTNNTTFNPQWWTYGMRLWASVQTDAPADERLRNLARSGYELVSLTNPNGLPNRSVLLDGCVGLGYDAGYSFINFLNAAYGGVETIAAIHQLIMNFTDVATAVEQVTELPFTEIENEWRAYLGFPPLEAEVSTIDLLEPAPNAPYQPGDMVTIPGPQFTEILQEPDDRTGLLPPCLPGQNVEILRVGSLDGVDWYEINCSGLVGWVTVDGLE